MEKSIRELITELAEVEDKIRALTLNNSGDGAFGDDDPVGGTNWSSVIELELRALHVREEGLCRALRARKSEEKRVSAQQ